MRVSLEGFALSGDRLWRVTGPNFVAGLTEYNDEVTAAAPIIRWARNGTFAYFRRYCAAHGWKLELVDESQ